LSTQLTTVGKLMYCHNWEFCRYLGIFRDKFACF